MKVMIRRNQAGVLSAYIAKKDLEEPIVEVEKAEIWGGLVKLANGWRCLQWIQQPYCPSPWKHGGLGKWRYNHEYSSDQFHL